MRAFEQTIAGERVRGFLHEAAGPWALALTHGAGANCGAPLLVSVADAVAAKGMTVLRFDLPFRQQRPTGPPRPGDAQRDRAGIRAAVAALRQIGDYRVLLGGHSYGGRQSSMAASEDESLAKALLLLSYPLHPPRRPEQLRTAHFPSVRTPALFVHGTRDPFATIEELEAARALIPARTRLVTIEGAGHDLAGRKSAGSPAERIADELARFVRE